MADLPDWATDDPQIAAPLRLLRRVHRCQVHDGRFDSSCFLENEKEQGLSVTLWESLADLDDIRRFHEDFGIICFDVAVARQPDVVIMRAALVGNLNHCEVYPKLPPRLRKACKRNGRWVHYPEWVADEHRRPVEQF